MLVVLELSSVPSNRHAFKDWNRNRGIIFEGGLGVLCEGNERMEVCASPWVLSTPSAKLSVLIPWVLSSSSAKSPVLRD